MDKKILIAAIEKAIQSGASPIPAQEFLGKDTSYVRTQTDISIEQPVLDTYVKELQAEPKMAAFDGMFANIPHGGGVSVGLPNIARLLLARAIATKDVLRTVSEFTKAIEENATDAVAVMGVSGVKADTPIQLGPDVQLVAMSDVAPSTQRGTALSQGNVGGMGPHFAIPYALVTRFKFGPVFHRPKTPQPPQEMGAHVPTRAADMKLTEALELLGVIGIFPQYQMSWVQSDNWFLSAGMSGGWQIARSREHWGNDVQIPKDKIEALAASYFSLDPQRRSKYLRIPIDRLGRAGREHDFADRAIDLGIALESLLLDKSDNAELSFRLSLRGAWMIGSDVAERVEIQAALKRLYTIRSKAVHSGRIEQNAETGNAIVRATEICRALITKAVELKCDVDWERLVMGGNLASPEPSPEAEQDTVIITG